MAQLTLELPPSITITNTSMVGPEKKKIKRSRLGCHRCKRLKVKCTEEKPACSTCVKARVECDYSLKLIWGGRQHKNTIQSHHSTTKDTHAFTSVFSRGSPCMNGAIQYMPSASTSGPLLLATPIPSHLTVEKVLRSPGVSLSSILNHAGEEEHGNQQYTDTAHHSHTAIPQTISVQDIIWPLGTETHQDLLDSCRNDSSSTIKSKLQRQTMHENTRPSQYRANFPDLSQPAPPVEQIDPVDFFASPAQAQIEGTPPVWYSDNCSADVAQFERMPPVLDASFVRSPPHSKDPFSSERANKDIASVYYGSAERPASVLQNQDESDPSDSALSRHSIPPLIVPLPQILLKVPYYRQLLQFWINVTAVILVPAPFLYKDNPFKKILPQMAMHYPGVLTTLLAFAARSRDDMECSFGTHLKIISHLLGRSCSVLLQQLEDDSEATSDGAFATSLLLSCYEVVHSNDFNKHRAHNTGASQIMDARTRKLRGSQGSLVGLENSAWTLSAMSSPICRSESDIGFFLLRWFIYCDVIGALSSTRDRGRYLRAFRNFKTYTPIESLPNFETEDLTGEIDYLLGFDPKLLPHFVNFALLIDEVEKYMANPDNNSVCLPCYIISAALEAKDKSLQTYEAGEARRLVLFDEMIQKNGRHSITEGKAWLVKDNILRSTNKLYYDAGLLNLYRRVFLFPRLSAVVQGLVKEMTDIFEYYIEPGSAAQLCTIFALFCAACDNLDDDKKQFFCSRFDDFARMENMNAVKSLLIVKRCWETGEDWMTAANTLDIDIVLL